LNLALFIDRELHAHAVLDGEVVCFDGEGRPRFYELMFGRGDPAFVAFDVLALEGRDIGELSLIERRRSFAVSSHGAPSSSSSPTSSRREAATSTDSLARDTCRDRREVEAARYSDVAPSSWIKIKNSAIARQGIGRI
jgi:ATP-dependent DNA ligase